MAPRLPDEELYDLDYDPREIHNLADSAETEHRRVAAPAAGRAGAVGEANQ